MLKETKADLNLRYQAVAGAYERILTGMPTMLDSDLKELLRQAYRYGYEKAKAERAQDIMLFKGFDPDEEKRGRYGRNRHGDQADHR